MSRLKTIQIIDLLADYKTSPELTSDPFYIEIPQSETENLAITPTELVDYMIHRYGEFSFTYYDYQNKKPVDIFIEEWNRYKHFNLGNWDNIMYAYSMDYNPIHNYDKTETHDLSKTYSENIHSSGTDYSNYTEKGSVENTQTFNDYKVQNKASTYDNTTANTTSQEITGSITNTRKPENYSSDTNNGFTNDTLKTTAEDTTTDTTTISGNIGVTTTQDMINSEINLRRLNMLEYIVNNFAHEHFALLNGDDDNEYFCTFLPYE